MNNEGNTSVHHAADGNSTEAIAMLIDHGALINITNNEGNTPKHHAAYGNSTEAIAKLIDHGASSISRIIKVIHLYITLQLGTQPKPLHC